MSEQSRERHSTEAPVALGGDLIIPLLAAGLTIYFLIDTASMAWEARATGTVIGLTLLALVAAQFTRVGLLVANREGSLKFGDLFERSTAQAQRLGLVLILTLFIMTIEWVGTTVGLFVTMAASMWVLGVRNVRTLIGISFCVSAVVYLLFIVLLKSRLPVGPVEGLIQLIVRGAT
jgi:hypothetical protein